ncbi:MAG: hypothetical protein KGQ60_10850 [Planctomycetes bacterium]|nr:hypothetical protein [Planctomycetota bacterium]
MSDLRSYAEETFDACPVDSKIQSSGIDSIQPVVETSDDGNWVRMSFRKSGLGRSDRYAIGLGINSAQSRSSTKVYLIYQFGS